MHFTGEFSGRAIRTLYHPAPSNLFFAFCQYLFTVIRRYPPIYHYIALITYLFTVNKIAYISLRWLHVIVHKTSDGHYLPRPIHFTNYVYWKFYITLKYVVYCNWNLHICRYNDYMLCCVHITSEGHCLPRPIHFTNYVHWWFYIYIYNLL